ncbi:hypothetical protein [Polaribacter sp.]|uniref:hypothetical protein n=1 Tax=Polaribacter sp. TaxID=1920175 RepID=UPI003F6B0428
MKKLFYYISLIIICTITSCNKKNKSFDIVGFYKSSKLNFIENLIYNTTKEINGLKLNLKKDSTFHYETCGLLIKGFWSISNDSLKLNVNNINFVNDSINKIRKPVSKKDFLIYKIENNSLFGFINEKNGIRINKLVRDEK